MVFSDTNMENIVFDILQDCRSVTPPLDRNEISQHVLGHLAPEIHKWVCATLEKLVEKGLVTDDREASQGRPVRYWLSQTASSQH